MTRALSSPQHFLRPSRPRALENFELILHLQGLNHAFACTPLVYPLLSVLLPLDYDSSDLA
jgi:hypothetical protein